ncbi:MAG: transglycosylase SLT domain-containing protein [Terriglobales bacterium]
MRRLNRAFVASVNLKPMARQLLENRSRAAYAGVEAYARKHAREDAGSLAYFVLGYAHILDRDYAKAIDPLQRARARAGDLGDYVAYYLATAYAGSGQNDRVVATLRDFSSKYPESLFVRDAMAAYAHALLSEARPADAVAVLEKYRRPARADIELMLGRAYAQTEQPLKAADALRQVYYGMPLSAEADDARTALDALSKTASLPVPSFAERKGRAQLLAQGGRLADAARDYRALLDDAPADERPAIQVALGIALHRSGNDREAQSLLENVADAPADSNAQRLFALAQMARSSDDEARFTDLLGRMRQTAATSSWFQEALLMGGNRYLLRGDYDKAIDHYRELQQRFPDGNRAAYAHWKAAWLTLRQGRKEEAKKEFEEEVAVYPGSPQVPAALYWRARLAEDDHDLAKARAWYQKLTDRFPYYYYAEMARLRLRELKDSPPSVSHASAVSRPANDDAVLDKIPPLSSPARFKDVDPPDDDIRVQKSMLLQNGGLTELAVRELRAAANGDDVGWANGQIARIYEDNGQYHRALQTLKRAVPTYFALDIDSLPRPYWEGLFPRPYWTELKRYAASNQLDPYLVASLIRQESEFNPGAVSRANALGLMQLLPGTGKKAARELRIRRFATGQLLSPDTNMKLGTHYFRRMLDQFDGRLEYALAAYNAGPDRVSGWLNEGKFRDPQEFVESIPFTETREYVQAILRNASVYRRLYGTPDK